ncbi:hypothetical protein C8R47DRAFT_958351, partial [Mycena vitilis]
LDTLPAELIEAVCRSLDALTTVRLTQVSRQFWRIFQQSSALQYQVQLELADMRDGHFENVGSAARLEILKSYQAAWENTDWSAEIAMDMGGDYWELVGNVLATYSSEKGFAFKRIPSAIRRIPPAEWSIEVPVGVNDFSCDLSQDLLLVVEVNSSSPTTVVHLLSLQTGSPHPLARNPHLSRDVDAFGPSPSHNFQIRIFGKYIGLMAELDDGDAELLVWEWQSGVLKKHLYPDSMTSFAFLDDHMLLISGFNSSAYPNFEPELRVLNIEGPLNDNSGYFHFQLPTLSDDFEFESNVHMMIQTEPPPSWPLGSHPEEPFTICHSDRLFTVSLQGWDGPTFMLCTLLSTLRSLMENPPAGTIYQTIAWDTWGPTCTRMLRLPHLPDPWVCFVYGQRCAIQASPTRCQILDFNP